MWVANQASAEHPTGCFRQKNLEIVKILLKGGANVDFEKQIVRFKPDLLMDLIAKAPGEFIMGARGDDDLDVILDGTRIHCGTAGTGTTTVDLETRQPRASIKNDITINTFNTLFYKIFQKLIFIHLFFVGLTF